MNIGSAIPFDQSELKQLSMVTPLDVQAARSLWLRAVPLRWKRLLESQTVGEADVLSTPFVWDPGARRYIHLQSRRYVPFVQLRDQAIEPLIVFTKNQMRSLSTQLATRDLRLEEWQQAMINVIKPAQVATALAVNGGEEILVSNDLFSPLNFAVAKDGLYFTAGTGFSQQPPASEPLRLKVTIDFLDLKTGRRTTIAHLDKGVSLGLALSPDERYLLYPVIESISRNLMLVEKIE